MKVKDIMTEDVITVDSKTKIKEIASILTENRIHGIPVMEKKKIIGIITETDLFVNGSENLYLPSLIDSIERTDFTNKIPRDKKNKIKELTKAKAEDIMSHDCMTIAPEIGVEKLLDIFKETKFHTMPVVDKNNLLCGIVTLADVIALIGEL